MVKLAAGTIRVTLKLYASLTDLLPADAQDHATEIDIDKEESINALIDRYRVPRKMAHLVLVNGVYIERPDRDSRLLEDGDVLAVWPPVAGG